MSIPETRTRALFDEAAVKLPAILAGGVEDLWDYGLSFAKAGQQVTVCEGFRITVRASVIVEAIRDEREPQNDAASYGARWADPGCGPSVLERATRDAGPRNHGIEDSHEAYRRALYEGLAP